MSTCTVVWSGSSPSYITVIIGVSDLLMRSSSITSPGARHQSSYDSTVRSNVVSTIQVEKGALFDELRRMC